MPIEIACSCGKRFRVADQFAGKSGKCPGCGSAFSVPVPRTLENKTPEAPEAYELDEPEIKSTDGGLRRLDDAEKDKPAGRTCTGCGKPMAEKAMICTACGRSTLTGKIMNTTDGDDDEKKAFFLFRPLLRLGDRSVTPMAMLVLLGLIGVPLVWYVTGPGRMMQVYSARRAHVMVAMKTGIAWDKSMAPTGAAKTAAKIVGGLGGAGGANASRDDTVGGSDELLVFRDDPDGNAVVIEIGLRQSIVNTLGATSGYDSVIKASDFELIPLDGQHGGKPLPASLLRKSFGKSQARLNLAVARPSIMSALPPAEPTRFNEQKEEASVSAIAIYNGETHGTVRLHASRSAGGMPAADGVYANGELETTHPTQTDFKIEHRYANGELIVDWDDADHARWSKARFKQMAEMSPWYRYKVGLMFVPADGSPVSGRYAIAYGGRELAEVDLTSASSSGSSGGGGGGTSGVSGGISGGPPVSPIKTQQGVPSHRKINPNNPLAYFDILLEAKDRGKGIVSASNLRQIGLMLMTYEQDRGKFPESFDELRGHAPGLDSMLANPRTGENPGFIYEKPPTGARPSETPVVWEAWQGQKDPNGAVLYADGSIR